MSRNGSGTYSLPAGNPVTTGTTISSTWANTTLSDIATALTNSIAIDGQSTPTANLPMGTFKLTGMGLGTALTDSLSLTQAQNGGFSYLSTVAGTNTITATASPVPSAYAAGQTFRFVAAATNTGATTLNISSLGAKSITKRGSVALVGGEIVSGALCEVTYDGTRFQLIGTANITNYWAGSSAGGTTAYTASVSGYAAYSAGDVVSFACNATNTGAVTLNISSLGAKSVLKANVPLQAGDIVQNQICTVVYDGTAFQLTSAGWISTNPNTTNGFRISAGGSTVPVDFSVGSANATLYMVPFYGNAIALYTSGPGWVVYNTAAISATPGGTGSFCQDVFCYSNAGVPTLELVNWTNTSTRATGLTTQDGVLVKSGDATRRYLGTILPNAGNTLDCTASFQSTWNYYNRMPCCLSISDATATWTYSTATWRQVRATSANRVQFVHGYVAGSGTRLSAKAIGNVTNSTATNRNCFIGIGLEQTNNITNLSNQFFALGSPTSTQAAAPLAEGWVELSSGGIIGLRTVNWLEIGAGTDTQTWTGTSGSIKSGMIVEYMA